MSCLKVQQSGRYQFSHSLGSVDKRPAFDWLDAVVEEGKPVQKSRGTKRLFD